MALHIGNIPDAGVNVDVNIGVNVDVDVDDDVDLNFNVDIDVPDAVPAFCSAGLQGRVDQRRFHSRFRNSELRRRETRESARHRDRESCLRSFKFVR
jgi:hypothetical protein